MFVKIVNTIIVMAMTVALVFFASFVSWDIYQYMQSVDTIDRSTAINITLLIILVVVVYLACAFITAVMIMEIVEDWRK